jgi:hypothetical protein
LLAAPAAPSISTSGSTTFCSGGNVRLTASGGTLYEWSNGPNTNVISNTNNITVDKEGSYAVRILPANIASCGSSFSTIKVTVNQLPNKPAVGNRRPKSFCEGDSTVLETTAASRYVWYRNNTLEANSGTLRQFTVKRSGAYRVEIIDVNGCLSPRSDTANVVTNPLPATPFIATDRSPNLCDNQSITLTSQPTDIAFLWNTGATTPNITVNTAGTYRVQTRNRYNCLSEFSEAIRVTVNPLPSIPTIKAEGDTVFCEGGTVQLSSTAAQNVWQPSQEKNAKLSVTKSGFYRAKNIDANGCESGLSNGIFVSVKPLPSKPVVTPEGIFSLVAQGSVKGETYNWKLGSNVLPAKTQLIKANVAGIYNVSSLLTYTTTSLPAGKLVCESRVSEDYVFSLPDDDDFRLSLYPNPSRDGIVYLETRENLLGALVTIFDITGKIVLEKRIEVLNERIKLDFSSESMHQFLVKVVGEDYNLTKRILIIGK